MMPPCRTPRRCHHTTALLAAACALAHLAPAEAGPLADKLLPYLGDRPIAYQGTGRTRADGTGTEFVVTLDAVEAATPHAVVVAVDKRPSPTPTRLSVNGSPLQFDPVPTLDADWHLVPAEYLVAGENTLALGSEAPPDEILVFPLEGDNEEIHFGLLANASRIRSQPAVDPRQEMMDVLHCSLTMTINVNSSSIPAATLELVAESLDNSLSQCVLDLDDNSGSLTVSSVDDGHGVPLAFTHSGGAERLVIDLPNPVPAGSSFTVRVHYSGTPRIGYGRTTHNGVPLIYTYSQPYDARGWWPCKDIPADKFTFDAFLTVTDATYAGYGITPVSNGRLVSVVNNGNGTKTFHWVEEFPVASYLVSICCTNYRPATGAYTALDGVTTMDVVHYLYPENYAGSSGEVPNTITVVEYFADLFGEYPFLTEKYSTAGWNISSGMEHQTCTSMPDDNLATPFHRRNVHELAHMWFGDMVTYHTYEHLWLAEGWASYCEALTYGHLYGPSAYHDKMNSWTISDSRPLISPNQDAFDTLTFRTAYYKGAWVLHMLRHAIGDDAFFGATRDYLASPAHRYGTATTGDYQGFFEARLGRDMSWFFDPWTTRTSRPNYEWSWSTRDENGDTIVDLGILQVQSDDIYIMPIDFEVVFSGGARRTITLENDRRSQGFSVNVGPGTVTDVLFDPDNWLLDYNTEVPAVGPPTEAPVLLAVRATGTEGEAQVTWESIEDLSATGYRLYQSDDGRSGWSLVRDENDLPLSATSIVIDEIDPAQDSYFRLAGVNEGAVGPSSEVYGLRLSGSGSRCLIVDGNDRWPSESASGGGNHDFSATHGRAVSAYGAGFDCCANEAVGSPIELADYPVVVWLLGNESTADESFSDAEQALVAVYLEQGGKLFVTGNEIGWDLGRDGSSSSTDRAFYRDYLKAAYVADDSGVYTVQGTGPDSVFADAAYAFGSGDAPYTPGYPDVIAPASGSLDAIDYTGGDGAGVQYFGVFSESSMPGAVIYLGFSFETVASETARHDLMRRVLESFAPAALPTDGLSLW